MQRLDLGPTSGGQANFRAVAQVGSLERKVDPEAQPQPGQFAALVGAAEVFGRLGAVDDVGVDRFVLADPVAEIQGNRRQGIAANSAGRCGSAAPGPPGPPGRSTGSRHREACVVVVTSVLLAISITGLAGFATAVVARGCFTKSPPPTAAPAPRRSRRRRRLCARPSGRFDPGSRTRNGATAARIPSAANPRAYDMSPGRTAD